VAAGTLKQPSLPDIMGYCSNPWISDYNYTAVMDFRGTALDAGREARMQPSVLVWGRIRDGQATLEPAFQIVTRPTRPRRGGTYTVTGLSEDGSRLFEFPFEPAQVAEDRRGSRQFALAVPLSEFAAPRLASLRVSGPGAPATASARTAVAGPTSGPESVSLRSTGRGAALEWNAAAHPMVLVRDPVTGEVLSFARGGRAEIRTARRELDVLMSDGVRSRMARLPVTNR
jgi:hypothetical protein